MIFTKTVQSTLFGVAALALTSGSALADGTYDLFSIGDANPMGEISIQDDVIIDGNKYVSWWIPSLKMMLYIPPQAAYVTMEENSPVIGKRFEGGWVSHKSAAQIGADACDAPETDHNGTTRPLWGQLKWTVTSHTHNYEFEIHLGKCDDTLQPWAQNVDAKG